MPPARSLKRASKPRLGDIAYERILELILTEHPGGSRLSEVELASTLGMSKTPVREALLRLASEGLVSPIPHIGYLVPPLSYIDLRQALEVREAVEGYLAMLAAERISDDDLAELRTAFNEGRAFTADSADDIPKMKELNSVLHQTIVRAADNNRLEQILAGVRIHISRGINELVGNDVDRYSESFEQHLGILDALEARDPVRAESAMRGHVRSVNAHILRRFR